MALLWENFVSQLDSVRASSSVWAPPASADAIEDTREQRLRKALEAVKNTGNTQMIESLQAALEGRQANLELPDLPIPGQTALSGPETYLAQISDSFKPKR
ncbi:MAG: hypothetical protein CBB80_002970 [Synechococcus sp. TMED20]|jgi:hypothetical protein|nr:MAG: hypothetical protein CBB80_002970 [Synechococcus sp. TMED20]|tara:strand:+ start:361 stop:663 length:303 start_codon:yes stop_codon:yes gene_type:complete